MTVGVAARSVHGKAIVIMADRRFTLGDGELITEEPIGKAFMTANGWLAVYAGNPTFAEAVVAHASTSWDQMKPEDQPTAQIGMMKHVHRAYLDEYEDAVERNVLRHRLLDTALWRERSLTDDFDESLRTEIQREFALYDREYGCELLLCGFDPRGNAQIVTVDLDDQQHEHEWAAIGSGGDIARGRLVWLKTHSYVGLARTLYEVYEATAHASMDPAVGENVNAWIMVRNGGDALMEVPANIMELVRSAFRFYDQTPFKRDRRVEDKTYDPPPSDWETTVGEWGFGVVPHPLYLPRRAEGD